jgi:uncharacterized protein
MAADVDTFKTTLRASFVIVYDLPPLTEIVRDPNDDIILVCAVAGSADYVVTRDDDLLSLDTYVGIAMVTPESFLALLRSAE